MASTEKTSFCTLAQNLSNAMTCAAAREGTKDHTGSKQNRQVIRAAALPAHAVLCCDVM
jgi:hypothetical protein